MWSTDFFVQLVTSLIGSAAFAVLFRIRLKHLPVAMIGGGIAYFVYFIINYQFSSVFAAAFIASAISAIYAEACARFQEAPAIIFVLPCAIPIVPGGSLYRAMFNLISQDMTLATQYLLETLKIAIGIAGGLAAVSLIFHLINSITFYAFRRNNKGNS
jgi:uncharacterized membrane protein YjjB (DUF3815 family)